MRRSKLKSSTPANERLFSSAPVEKKLILLEQHFNATVVAQCQDDWDRKLIEEIKSVRELLRRPSKQVTFFGVFKAGKSTLLNALLGTEILPSRTNRATGVVTKISYASRASARAILGQHPTDSRTIPLRAIASSILLDVSHQIAQAPEQVERVEIGLPLPWLKNYCLTDTPGLSDNAVFSDRTEQELAQTDISVMILSADKLLSQAERDAAQRVHTLLNGNIIFVLNRMGLIEPEEREEVLEWAEASLAGFGNRIVGSAKLFVTDAKAALNARTNGVVDGPEEYLDEVFALESWLRQLFGCPAGEKAVVLSRLGILDSYLRKARSFLQIKLAQANAEIADLKQQATLNLKVRQVEFNQINAEVFQKLAQLKNEINQLEEGVVADVTNKAHQLIHAHDPGWNNQLRKDLSTACQSYIATIEEKAKSALGKIELELPPLNSEKIQQSLEIVIEKDLATSLADVFGQSSVLAASRWIGCKVAGIDLKQKNIEAVGQTSYQTVSTLRQEAEKYLKEIEARVNKYSQLHQPQWIAPAGLDRTREAAKHCHQLIAWCEDFQNDIKIFKEEAVSWISTFDSQWEHFTKSVKSLFRKNYEQIAQSEKQKINLNLLANQIIKEEVKTWYDSNHFHGAWLGSLRREQPILAAKLEQALNNVRVVQPLKTINSPSKLEVLVVIVTIVGVLVILLWGQSPQNFDFTEINLQQGFTAFGLSMGGVYSLKRIRKYQQIKNKISLTRQIIDELINHKYKLTDIVAQAEQASINRN